MNKPEALTLSLAVVELPLFVLLPVLAINIPFSGPFNGIEHPASIFVKYLDSDFYILGVPIFFVVSIALSISLWRPMRGSFRALATVLSAIMFLNLAFIGWIALISRNH